MTLPQIIFLALCMGFTWVYKLKILRLIKPFNCCPCMTAWFSFFIYLCTAGLTWWTLFLALFVYLPIGLFFGSLFELLKSRWL